MAWKPCVPVVSLGNLCGMSSRLHWLQWSFMLPQHGGDFLTQPRRVASSWSLTKRSATATYQVVLKMYIVLSIIWNPNFSIVFCLIRGMSCTNYYLLKRILDIACGHVPIILLCLSLIIIWSGRIFCIESYLWIPTRCMCRCISTYWCLYVYFDVLHSLHIVCRLVYLTHFHFCTHIHAVVIICVCQIFIKETACLHVSLFPGL